MSSRATTIELNGKRYDTLTGKVLHAEETQKTHAPATHGKVMDGVRPTKSMKLRKHTPVHAHRSRPEKSKTLMRGAVKKPTGLAQKIATPVVNKHETPRYDVDPKRATRAQTVKKSTLVSRFGTSQKAITPVTAELHVRPEPQAPPPIFDAHKKSAIAGSHVHKKIFEQAIQKAETHNQPKAKKVHRSHKVAKKLRVSPRALNLAAGSLTALLLIGFIAYQNVPNVTMRVANMRAGVDGRLPGYAPAGFGLAGPIQYQPGEIRLQYASRSDDRAFAVNQRASGWDSQTLLEQYVASEGTDFQTFQDGGKTVYVYNANNATWVDGGVWYQIEGESALNSDQLLRMAASM